MSARLALAVRPPRTDADLLQATRAGDERATELLVRRYNRTLYRTARAILRDDAEAEDAVQEAYIQAFQALDSFRGESSLSTWLVRIVANEALMRRRRQSRRAQVLPIDHDNGEYLMQQVAATPDCEPDREAMSAQLRQMLEQRIDALPDLYRTVFVMRAIEEMSVEETAAALGLPEATVRTRFFRARALMRASLEQDVERTLAGVFAFDGERCDRIVRSVLERLAQG